ncbi:MAG: hypothetical protein IJT21_02335 [Synergistaceae bacterium]|nr:hypothetical protein [Synergistaceae bacterium]
MPENNNRITSPEQLNNYIRISNPGVWIILGAIIAFLAGLFVWIFMGQIEISFRAPIFMQGHEARAFLAYGQVSQLQNGMTVRIDNTAITGTITNISHDVMRYDEIIKSIGRRTSAAMHINEFDRLFAVSMKFDNAPQNVSEANFITGIVKPVHFLLR